MNVSNNIISEDLDYIFNSTASMWNEIRGKQLFLTGATGFFGTWLLESFIEANKKLDLNAKVVVLTRNLDAFQKQSPHICSNRAIRFHIGDVRNYEFPIKDRMESFDILSSYFNDIRGSAKRVDKRNIFSLKKFILQHFPDSYNIARKLKRSMIAENDSLEDITPEEASCFEHEDILVKAFLDNQKTMREILKMIQRSLFSQ